MAEETQPQPQAPAPESSSGAGDDKTMAALSYLGILVLIPLLTKKGDKFVMHHAKQGLVLLIAEVIFGFAGWILAFIPVIGWLISTVVWLYIVIMIIMGLINAAGGKHWEMPLLGGFAKNINL